MLDYDAINKAWQVQAARLHPDNRETGDEAKSRRLNELWTEIKAAMLSA
jgi:hypothetical protein